MHSAQPGKDMSKTHEYDNLANLLNNLVCCFPFAPEPWLSASSHAPTQSRWLGVCLGYPHCTSLDGRQRQTFHPMMEGLGELLSTSLASHVQIHAESNGAKFRCKTRRSCWLRHDVGMAVRKNTCKWKTSLTLLLRLLNFVRTCSMALFGAHQVLVYEHYNGKFHFYTNVYTSTPKHLVGMVGRTMHAHAHVHPRWRHLCSTCQECVVYLVTCHIMLMIFTALATYRTIVCSCQESWVTRGRANLNGLCQTFSSMPLVVCEFDVAFSPSNICTLGNIRAAATVDMGTNFSLNLSNFVGHSHMRSSKIRFKCCINIVVLLERSVHVLQPAEPSWLRCLFLNEWKRHNHCLCDTHHPGFWSVLWESTLLQAHASGLIFRNRQEKAQVPWNQSSAPRLGLKRYGTKHLQTNPQIRII